MNESGARGCWRVGTSGWVYGHWRESFYPAALPQAQWFAHYARSFDTVEINNTFYRLPGDAAFDHWREQAPPGFLYAVKANRYITHVRRLIDCAEPMERFLSRARRLETSLGPLLYQLPPRWHANAKRLAGFIPLLPTGLVNVFEFRDPTWFVPEIIDLLRGHELSFCIYDSPVNETPHEVTAHAVYVRMHGPPNGSYSEDALRRWAEAVRGWCDAGHDVYVYFNNDIGGHAVRNALRLKDLLA